MTGLGQLRPLRGRAMHVRSAPLSGSQWLECLLLGEDRTSIRNAATSESSQLRKSAVVFLPSRVARLFIRLLWAQGLPVGPVLKRDRPLGGYAS
jgi:hypothetical protein